jgi:uncharacterized protein (DUF1800 family)
MRSQFVLGSSFRICLTLIFLSLLVLQPVSAFSSPNGTKAALTADQRIMQVLSRLSFGARPGDVEAIKKLGIRTYIEQQLIPDAIDDSALNKRLEKLPTLMLANPTLAEQYNPPKPKPTPTPAENSATANVMPTESPMPIASPTASPKPTPIPKNPGMVVTELQRAKLLRAVYSNRQLNEVMVDFWENHFSIYANKDADRLLLTSFDRDSVRPFAMGRFRDLLGATAHSPAMLFYLDNWQSSVLREYPATKDKPARKTGGVNENYARELMELHTLGVGGGYTQKDVEEVARCFTGWTIRKPNEEGIFFFNPAQHDNGEKVVLGQKIAAGGGIADGERVLDILAKSPATAKFVATKMARRFIGDNPPATLVNRAAAVFLKTDGSITETLRAIVTSPEFFSSNAYQTKVKSPFEFVASALRVTNAETDANSPVLGWIARMGQPVYGRVTPDGYPDVRDGWLSNNDLLARLNFAIALTSNGIKGTKVDVKKLLPETADDTNIAKQVARDFLIAGQSKETVASLEKAAALMGNTTSASATPTAIPNTASQWTATPTKATTGPPLAAQLIALTLGSPDFQRR